MTLQLPASGDGVIAPLVSADVARLLEKAYPIIYIARMKSPPRILIAEEPRSMRNVVRALEGYDLLTALTIPEAERLLMENRIDLFVIGVHFDDSQAMDLIKLVRQDGRHKQAPVIVLRQLPAEHANILRQALDVMRTVGVISEYIEEDGTSGIEKRIRVAVDTVVGAERLSDIQVHMDADDAQRSA